MRINNTLLELRSIKQLMGMKFHIASYQRGYRWTQNQVKQLLDDLKEFSRKDNKTKGEFYCLQPLVVKPIGDNVYEVIDGQQRLTTLLIIMRYLEDVINVLYPDTPFYDINYETRPDSAHFLQNIKELVGDQSNVDYFFMSQAYITIEEWFKSPENKSEKPDIAKCIVAQKVEMSDNREIDIENNLRVIWYEVSDPDTHPVDIFTRLNIGKIPLTNAELIKALFLRSKNYPGSQVHIKQLQIATEWDTIEKTLQNDSFWCFIHPSKSLDKYTNRIEYIFDLMKVRESDSDRLYTFFAFSEQLSNNGTIDQTWLEVKQYFLCFDEWFQDPELYHYIGFLIDGGSYDLVRKLRDESQKRSKSSFKTYLKNEIKSTLGLKPSELNELMYGTDINSRKKIRLVLLLLNIQTILKTQKSDMRFPFDRYRGENWDIEHISSQNSVLGTEQSKRLWAKDVLVYLEHEKEYQANGISLTELKEKLNHLLASKTIHEAIFENCRRDAEQYFGENISEVDIDHISNLTLLNSKTNRGYGDAFFSIKRKWIVENDKYGIFVPIATKNIFLKYYSKSPRSPLHWSSEDAQDYFEAIESILKDFLIHE